MKAAAAAAAAAGRVFRHAGGCEGPGAAAPAACQCAVPACLRVVPSLPCAALVLALALASQQPLLCLVSSPSESERVSCALLSTARPPFSIALLLLPPPSNPPPSPAEVPALSTESSLRGRRSATFVAVCFVTRTSCYINKGRLLP